jgi:hypothetical protein
MKTELPHTCPSCGNEFSGAMGFCPVCTLRKALGGAVESGESSLENASIDSSPALLAHRFEHYELVNGEDGKPIELGRGAMGVTYKAFDVDLHCPVTLKVIKAPTAQEEVGQTKEPSALGRRCRFPVASGSCRFARSSRSYRAIDGS